MSEQETRKILEIFKEYNIQYEILTHAPTITGEDSARVRGSLLKQGVKAIVVKTRSEPHMFLVVNLPTDKKINFKKLEQFTGFPELTMATQEEILQETGCERGAIPPFGHKKQLLTVVDLGVLDNEINEFNAGQTTVSAKVPTTELKRLFTELKIRTANITK